MTGVYTVSVVHYNHKLFALTVRDEVTGRDNWVLRLGSRLPGDVGGRGGVRGSSVVVGTKTM